MAMLFMEGWDQYANINEIRNNERIQLRGTAWTFPVVGRDGSSQAIHDRGGIGRFMGFDTDNMIVGFAVKATDMWDANNDLLLFKAKTNGGEQLVIRSTSAGELAIDRGGTNLDVTSGLGLTEDIWYYIEVGVLIHPSAGTYEIRVDGVDVLSDTGVNTENISGGEIATVEFDSDISIDAYFDDFYMLDDTGLDNNDFLGDTKIATLLPAGDGNRNDFTRFGGGSANSDAVDDGIVPDDDTTYNHGTTVDDAELYTFDSLPEAPVTVFAIQVTNRIRSNDAGDRQVRSLVRSNTTEAEGASKGITGNEFYTYQSDIYETNPDGGGAWDEASVNAVEAGITIES